MYGYRWWISNLLLPARSEQGGRAQACGLKRRAASRAGKSKPNREVQDVKRQLQALVDDVLEGRRARSIAAVCSQILNIKLRAIEIERKSKETEELEERLEALESQRSVMPGHYN